MSMSNIVELGDGTGAVRAACREAMQAAGLSIARASREIGIATATPGRWLRGSYPGDVPKVTARVSSWLQTRREGAAHSLAGAGPDRFAATGASAEIADALSYAQASGDIVLVHGPSGRGKTRTAAHYRAAHTGVACLSATGAMVTMPGLLGCVLEAVCGYRERGSALEAERAIVESLRGRGALLMIDEAHYLRAGLLDELRRIRDHAGCGLALIGSDGVRMTLERCRRSWAAPACGSISSIWPSGTWPPSPLRGLSGAGPARPNSRFWCAPRGAGAACTRCAAC